MKHQNDVQISKKDIHQPKNVLKKKNPITRRENQHLHVALKSIHHQKNKKKKQFNMKLEKKISNMKHTITITLDFENL